MKSFDSISSSKSSLLRNCSVRSLKCAHQVFYWYLLRIPQIGKFRPDADFHHRNALTLKLGFSVAARLLFNLVFL